jgi:acyl dehydratase
MSYEIGALPEGTAAGLNYGLDKVRFLTPVKAGSKVRMRSVLMSFEDKGPGQYLMKVSNTVEIEGEGKPALIAEALVMLVAGRPPKKA